MLRSLLRFSILLVMLSAIAACAPVTSTLTRMPDATPTSEPTITPRPTWTPFPTEVPPPTETPTPTPAAPYPPLAAIARGQVMLDGSTSTDPLRALIACKALGETCFWDSYSDERRILFPSTYSQFIWDAIGSSGTHGAYVTLMEGKSDVILVARAPSDAEVKSAKELGVTFDARPVALDALVFLANVQNPVSGLGLQDARSIYAGKTKDWKEIGGSPGEIKAYQREEESGSQELLKTLVMRGIPPIDAPEMILAYGMAGVYNIIGEQPLGIGYSVYYYATAMLPDGQVKLLSIDAVQPTSETIAARTYPLVAEVYVVVRGGLPNDHPTLRVRDWLLSEAGQAVVKASGYVPVPPSSPTRFASSSRVQWAYQVSALSLERDALADAQSRLNIKGSDGWQYIGQLWPTSRGTALFIRPSVGADKWAYQFARPEAMPAQANLLGADGWDKMGGLAIASDEIFARSPSHPTQWEYQAVEDQNVTAPEFEAALNREGVKGWEVNSLHYYFYNSAASLKRPLDHSDRWSYEIVTCNMGVLDAWNSAMLREEGQAGWEYVPGSASFGSVYSDEPGHYLLKRPSANATPWEYKGVAVGGLLSGPPEPLERFLNEQGQDGWELVDMTRYELFFRRHP